MAPVFSKEAIFSGEVDYLCLVCEGYFTNELQVREHISEEGHRIHLKETEYVEKYKGDCIRKVKKWYFCELCNVLLTTIKVGLHIADPKHKKKVTKIMERVGDLVTISGKVAINEEAWHCLSRNSCTLCNVDFDDIESHKGEIDHIVNLIQSEVTALDNIVYRKVFGAFHCLTCNEAIAEVEGHVHETKHMELFKKSHDFTPIKQDDKSVKKNPLNDVECDKAENVNFTVKNKVENNMGSIEQGVIANALLCRVDDKSNDILDSIQEFEKNQVNINFETCTAICKQCSTDLEFNSKDIKNHITKHGESMSTNTAANKTARPLLKKDEKNEKIDAKILFSSPVHLKNNVEKNKECLITKSKNTIEESKNPLKDDAKRIQKENNLRVKVVKNNIENDSQVIQKHIEQNSKTQHSNSMESIMKGSFVKNCYLQKVPAVHFVQEITIVQNYFMNTECIINQQYCINFFSFVFCSIIRPELLMCDLCKETQTNDNLMVHIKTEKHLRRLEEVPVILHQDSEFIREIRTDYFHCGFCNIIKASWQEMKNHLKSTGHKESKNASSWRLEMNLQEMKRRNIQQGRTSTFSQSLRNLNF